jgi:hypothetical protein
MTTGPEDIEDPIDSWQTRIEEFISHLPVIDE